MEDEGDKDHPANDRQNFDHSTGYLSLVKKPEPGHREYPSTCDGAGPVARRFRAILLKMFILTP